ncbi:putative Ovochymase-1 [Hypsibius exemplaris]|uniref:Ovochymase-1 n=1 Tax=Hypsibius exemplaris TaxID=2072580 RepID=A0A1W0WWC2_HYPEX|nr:putative Ovochymase-1 [Hypsibius exemplaris]
MISAVCGLVFLATLVTAQNDGCKVPAILTGPSGTISSPFYHYFPEFEYPNNLNCRWTINVGTGKNVRFTFSPAMALEDCSYDWVAIFSSNRTDIQSACSGGSANALAGPFCPLINLPATPPPFILIGNSFVIEFCTDGSATFHGFELTFNETDDLPAPPATFPPAEPCGSTVVQTGDTPVFIQSPNYPANYPDDISCAWNISTADPGRSLVFHAEAFSTERAYDILELTDENAGVTVGSFSGSAGPSNLRTRASHVYAVFVSDDSNTYTGFRIRITSHVPKCPVNSGFCPNTGDEEFCFEPNQLCDGKPECPNGADENCPRGCGTPVFPPLVSTKSGERIVGGVEAKPHSWPWQISMLFNGNHRCGGSIIDHHWIVTAAHCHAGDDMSAYKVRVGEHDIEGDAEMNAWSYDVELFILHQRYEADAPYSSDIALLKTKMPIFFNDHVHPVCLGSALPPPVGTTCFTTGWGSTEQRPARTMQEGALKDHKNIHRDTKVGDPLRQVDIKIVDPAVCVATYAAQNDPAVITADMICGYNDGKDSCQGDSGGPFVCSTQANPNVWELVGVVSWGYGCASEGVPGVYARTSHFLDWISETIVAN